MDSKSPVRICAGELPQTFQLGSWAGHAIGCSLAASRLELVLTLEPSPRTRSSATFFQQQPLPQGQALKIDVAGCMCGDPHFLQHVVTVHCRCVATLPLLSAKATITQQPSTEAAAAADFELRTKPMRSPGHLLACTGRAIHGDLSQRLDLMREAQSRWRLAGFNTTFTFAPSASACAAMRQIPGVVCEQRAPVDADAAAHTSHVFEQPVLHALCLAYSRAAGAEFLALADTDDLAPRGLPHVLNAVRQNGRLAGVRLFFDAERTCPSAVYCPDSEADWREKCPRASNNAAKPRNHWKPIVLPNRTREVEVHQFWPRPTSPGWLRKQVWRVCFHHAGGQRAVSAALDATDAAGADAIPLLV